MSIGELTRIKTISLKYLKEEQENKIIIEKYINNYFIWCELSKNITKIENNKIVIMCTNGLKNFEVLLYCGLHPLQKEYIFKCSLNQLERIFKYSCFTITKNKSDYKTLWRGFNLQEMYKLFDFKIKVENALLQCKEWEFIIKIHDTFLKINVLKDKGNFINNYFCLGHSLNWFKTYKAIKKDEYFNTMQKVKISKHGDFSKKGVVKLSLKDIAIMQILDKEEIKEYYKEFEKINNYLK